MKIGIIGAGIMGRMLAGSLAGARHELMVSDIKEECLNLATRARGVRVTSKNSEAVEFGEIVLVAVKPQQFRSLEKDLAGVGGKKILISVLAGTPMSKYTDMLGDVKLARIMPNLPISLGKGVVGVSYASSIDDEDRQKIEDLLAPLGMVVAVDEKQIDIVTALAGSGPAYVFLLIEALADGGVKLGLPYEKALDMAIATFEGSAALLRKSKKHPAEFRSMVSSPGGTTVEGLYVLEKSAVRSALIKAVERACNRARELGLK